MTAVSAARNAVRNLLRRRSSRRYTLRLVGRHSGHHHVLSFVEFNDINEAWAYASLLNDKAGPASMTYWEVVPK